MSAVSADSSQIVSLQEFLRTTPVQLTAALVHLGPFISFCAWLAQILSWATNSWYDSWLLLLAWTFLCLFSGAIMRFALPLALLGAFHFAYKLPARTLNPSAQMIHERTLESVLTDLHTLRSLVPTLSSESSWSPPPNAVLLRTALILTPISIFVVNLLIPPRVILALAGACIITWRAPWAIVIRRRLWNSAWIRWSCFRTYAWLTGLPLPYSDIRESATRALSTSSSKSQRGNAVQLRFLFTIYENQRWWMGLDYTAALLPNERPSWCSHSQHPVQPPTTFSLPEPTSLITTDPSPHGTPKKIRRTAVWRWEDLEWKVLVRLDGAPTSSRVEKPLPTHDEGSTRTALLAKAAKNVLKDTSSESPDPEKDSSPRLDTSTAEQDIVTDTDGWVYGDNKWQASSSKGTMGKFTRYRRWTRVAVVEEHVEELDDEFPLQPLPRSTSPSRQDSMSPSPPITPPATTVASPSGEVSSPTRGGRDILRNRLKSLTTSVTSSP